MPPDALHSPRYMRWLPSATIASVTRLEFVAHRVMEGFVAGRHRSARKGFSVEFAEHRQYTPGDDIRKLDWRVLARKDRYYIKQYVEETNLRATILLDASGSMAYCGDAAASCDGRRLSKFDYGRHIAAVLSYMLVGQQDAVGLVTFDSKLRTYIPARARVSQIRTLLETIDATEPGHDTRLAAVFHDIAERVPRRSLVIIISDLFDNTDEILNALQHFCFRRHEVVLFHLMAEEEVTFPFTSFTRFCDLESDQQVPTDPKTIRAGYLDRIRAFLKDLTGGCGRMGIDYVAANTAIPFEKMLTAYLVRRRQGGA